MQLFSATFENKCNFVRILVLQKLALMISGLLLFSLHILSSSGIRQCRATTELRSGLTLSPNFQKNVKREKLGACLN